MSLAWKRVEYVVRPRCTGKAPVLLCAAAFCLTAAAVYGFGYERWKANRPRPTFTATALVVEGENNSRIPFSCTDADLRLATQAANAQAEEEAVRRRAAWRRNLAEPCRIAREAVERTEEEYRESTARLDAFERQNRKAEIARAAAVLAKKSPPLIENPRWLELRKKLSHLEQRRDQLLIDRTPLHPAVREVDDEIVGVQEQLAAVEPKIATAMPTSEPPLPNDERDAQINEQQRAELTRGVKLAQRACEEAQRAEKEIVNKQRAGPQLVVQYAEAVQDAPPPDPGWQRLLWTSLMAGIFMTFGVGSLSAGSKIEPPVASVAEVETDLGLPILGTIPGDGPEVDAAAIGRQWQARRATLALGLFLMGGTPLLAIWGVTGI